MILAHYMPWFEAGPARAEWGWHWTMNAYDPQTLKDGKRSIASHYYPLIGPYDSGDPHVIEYHLLLMRLSGIDGIVVDWYGLSDLFDYALIHRNTLALFKPAARLGLKIAICYEDQTIPKLVSANQLAPSERVAHARRELEWLRQNWFAHPAYLRHKGKPVLLSFGSDGLTDAEWEQALAPPGSLPLYLSLHRRRSAAAGSFDWPLPQRGLASLDTFYQSAKGDDVSLPVAFPRFHDIYKEAKVGDSYGYIGDDKGGTFVTTLARALKSGASFVQIATWNDWGEGTVIEPSREWGYRDLETIQRYARKRLPSGKAATPDDLRLPHQLWLLRGQQVKSAEITALLEQAARRLGSGDISEAARYLARAEAAHKRAKLRR